MNWDMLINELGQLSSDEAEAFWPKVEGARDRAEITPEEYADLANYMWGY